MAQNDPSTTGGLFIGRRPGTGPLRYREQPPEPAPGRRLLDRALAGAVLAIETLVCSTLWGPQPAGWLWVGSQVDYHSGSVVLGIFSAFAGMTLTMMATIGVAMRLDRVWKLVRRAAGFQQKDGVLERIFVISAFLGGTAFAIWLLVIQGPGPQFSPRQ
jgi:hypothetical protein